VRLIIITLVCCIGPVFGIFRIDMSAQNFPRASPPVARPRNTSKFTKRTLLDDGIEDVTSEPVVVAKKQGSASFDNLMSIHDIPYISDLSNSLDDRYKSTPRMQAPPPTDDENEYLIQGRTAPLSMIDDDLNNLGDGYEDSMGGITISSSYCDSEKVLFKLGTDDNEVTFEMSTSPIEMMTWHDAMQNSVKIEPSPERTLERTKKKSQDEADGYRAAQHRPVDSQIIEQKLNTFFGESKEGFTELESAVYKSLILGPSAARVRHESGNSQETSKLKKASTSYLASKITNLYPSTNQLKTAKKGSERESFVSKYKDRKAWRGIVSRTFKRHTASTSLDPSEDVSVATFGVPLDVCPTSKIDALVPLIVEVCVHIVEDLGSDSQGIYRVPGHSGSVTELVDEVNKCLLVRKGMQPFPPFTIKQSMQFF